jgi:hypothetical protein
MPQYFPLNSRLVRYLKEKQTYFRSKHDKFVNLKRYEFRGLLFTSLIHIERQDMYELKDIFKRIPQIHSIFGISCCQYENIFAVFCYMRKGFRIDKENVPPSLERFTRRLYMVNYSTTELEYFNFLPTTVGTSSNTPAHNAINPTRNGTNPAPQNQLLL